MSFAAHRQHRFAVDSASKEYGVAYEFEGTLDAIRSMPEDWLWLVNSSSTVEARLGGKNNQLLSRIISKLQKLRNTRCLFKHPKRTSRTPYLNQSKGRSHRNIRKSIHDLMKCYQRISLVSSKDLMYTLIHLRNILWLHTFKNMWVQGPNDGFRQSLDIPERVISSIFAKPDLIEETEGAVMSSGDMKGINLVKIRCSNVEKSKRNCLEKITEEDRENYKQRMKFPVHVPDMILINY